MTEDSDHGLPRAFKLSRLLSDDTIDRSNRNVLFRSQELYLCSSYSQVLEDPRAYVRDSLDGDAGEDAKTSNV
jgi:hypothetical protein